MPASAAESSSSTRMRRLLVGAAISFLASASLVAADKDSDYYYPGFTNPNTGNDMYWKDSVNVLQDLDQFDSLYIKYHRCVWSKYGMRYGSGEDYDEQGADDDGNNDESGCGSWGGEYFWYMGRSQCFKAQAAYSLYGVLKGKTAKIQNGSVCHKHTYINSFFTTFGIESFAGPLGIDTGDVSSQCQSQGGGEGGGGGGENNGYDDVANDDDYLDDNFQFYNYADYTSIGIGCSSHGTFVQDQYKGAFCKGRNYEVTLDSLASLNTAMESEECTQIYDANGNDDQEDRQLEQEDYNFDDMEAVRILSFSKSCSLRQYPNDCPDPYGLKKKYAKRIERGFAYKTGSRRDIAATSLKVLAAISVAGGLFFLGASMMLQRNAAARMERRKRRKARQALRRRAKSSKHSSSVHRKSLRTGTQSGALDPEAEGYVEQQGVERVVTTMDGEDDDNHQQDHPQDEPSTKAKSSKSSVKIFFSSNRS